MEFSRLATFERSAKGLFSEGDIFELELFLAKQPEAGDVIPKGKGLRKVRHPAKGHGKRGGARVIYYYVSDESLIYLVFAYAKNEREDLTVQQLKQLGEIL